MLAGRCCRLLHDQGTLGDDEIARRLRLAFSRASEPAQAAAWLEGLLRGSGLLLLHNDALWDILDAWVTTLPGNSFDAVLPLLRRTFSTFPAPERRQMGERVCRESDRPGNRLTVETDVDHRRANAVLPLLTKLLGLDNGGYES